MDLATGQFLVITETTTRHPTREHRSPLPAGQDASVRDHALHSPGAARVIP
ncbi:hypothetical protein [Streptomyces sp. NPDC049590]